MQGIRSGLDELHYLYEDSSELKVVNEVSSFNGVFPIDAMIFEKGNVVAMVEIDGPQHYRDDGQLKRKDLLKQSMYENLHPGRLFKRIRWDEANKVSVGVIVVVVGVV